MHEVTSNKSQFLIFEINWLSNDLFFFSLNSHNGFIMPLVSFLFPLREKRKCRKPTWNAILIKIFRLFSQKWCWPGWEKDKENGFISSIWFFKMYSSTGRESISSLEKEKKKQLKKGIISRPGTLYFLKSENLKTWKKARERGFFVLSSKDTSSESSAGCQGMGFLLFRG